MYPTMLVQTTELSFRLKNVAQTDAYIKVRESVVSESNRQCIRLLEINKLQLVAWQPGHWNRKVIAN